MGISRKLLVALLTGALMFSNSMVSMAEEGAFEPQNPLQVRSNELTLEVISNMSPEQLESLELLPLNQMSRVVNSSYTIPSYCVRQAETYYCGPASVLQILKSSGLQSQISGSSDIDKQRTLASSSYLYTDRDNGTWIGYIPAVMDEVTGRNREWTTKLINPNDYSTLTSLQYFTRSNLAYNYGTIFLVFPRELEYYNGSGSTGHYISCSGMYYDDTSGLDYSQIRFRVNDPHYSDQYFGEHVVELENLADAMYDYSVNRGPNNFVY